VIWVIALSSVEQVKLAAEARQLSTLGALTEETAPALISGDNGWYG
jgi:hypothetical protein